MCRRWRPRSDGPQDGDDPPALPGDASDADPSPQDPPGIGDAGREGRRPVWQALVAAGRGSPGGGFLRVHPRPARLGGDRPRRPGGGGPRVCSPAVPPAPQAPRRPEGLSLREGRPPQPVRGGAVHALPAAGGGPRAAPLDAGTARRDPRAERVRLLHDLLPRVLGLGLPPEDPEAAPAPPEEALGPCAMPPPRPASRAAPEVRGPSPGRARTSSSSGPARSASIGSLRPPRAASPVVASSCSPIGTAPP